MTGIIDYNAGNIRSVEHALNSLGIANTVSGKPHDLLKADRLIFPGVGNARYAMDELKRTGFDSFLKDAVAAGTPVLGICLGSQIIFDHSEEGDADCLGLVRGTVRHFDSIRRDNPDSVLKDSPESLKVPHMGWNDLIPSAADCPLFYGIHFPAAFYFVHSFVIVPDDPSVIAGTAEYGISVPAAIRCGCISALQFHPEKSGAPGLAMLANFCRENSGVTHA
jgi:glutamine amidotransferase